MNLQLSRARIIQLVTVASVATACGDQPRSVASYEARDSAGIQIHEYNQAAFAAAPRWTVSGTPVLDIGSGPENDSRYEFFRVESVGRFSNGEFVVLDSGTREIRVYDAGGRHIRGIGRIGTGPGEFVGPRWFHVMDGDSLLLFDLNQHRLTIFGSDGEPVRTVAVGPLNLGYNPAIGPLEDRSFLVPTAHGARQPPSENGLLRRDSLVYRRFSTTGEELPPFGAYPGRETFLLPDGPRRTLLEPLGFGRSFELVSGDSLIYLGQTDSYEVRAFTHAGQLRQIIRVMLDPVPVTSAMIAAFKDHNIEIYGDSVMIAGFRRVREAMPYPATTPAFLQLAVDDEQNLWVRQYPAFPDSSAIWHIFSPTGHLSGRVELPARFEPNVFQSYVITGIWTDDESVEHLRSYALERRNRS